MVERFKRENWSNRVLKKVEGNERGWKGMQDNIMNVKKSTKLNRINGNKKGLKGMKEDGRGKNEGRNKT